MITKEEFDELELCLNSIYAQMLAHSEHSRLVEKNKISTFYVTGFGENEWRATTGRDPIGEITGDGLTPFVAQSILINRLRESGDLIE